MGEAAENQRLIGRVKPLRPELVADQPAVGAEGVFLQRRTAEGLDLPQPGEHGV